MVPLKEGKEDDRPTHSFFCSATSSRRRTTPVELDFWVKLEVPPPAAAPQSGASTNVELGDRSETSSSQHRRRNAVFSFMEEEAEVSIVEREDGRRRHDAKPFYYGAALILFVSASFCAAAFVPTIFSRSVYVMDEVVCASSGCQALAKLINGSVNGDLDPCDDFYAYVCGGWRRSHALKPTEQRRNVFDEVEQSVRTRLQDALWKTFRLQSPKNRTRAVFAKLASVYVACTKSLTPEGNGVVSMRKLLKHIGLAWPDEDAPYRSNATDLLELLVTLAMKWDVNVLFSFSIKSLSKERGAIVLGLPTPLIQGKLTDARTSLYEKLIVSLAFLFGRRNEYGDFARRLVAVERDIAKFRNHDQTLLTYMVKDLGNLCADFPWQKWMAALNRNLPTSAALTAQKSVIVNHPAYIGWLLAYFLGHDYPEDIKAYLALRVLLRYGQATYDIRHVQEIVLRGAKDIPADEVMRTCQQWMAKLLPDTWNSFVSQALVKPADVDRLKQLVSDVKNVFVQRVHRAEWMDSATKNISILKAKNIAFNVPSFARDAALDKAYTPLLSDARISGSSFLDLASQLIEAKYKSDVLSMYHVIGLSDSATEHSRANAMYVYSLNVVNVNAALLALPFYAAEVPLSVIYGGLGAIVAHEIIHGFDVSGRLYDDMGGFEDWWSNATTAAYRETSACFVDQMRGLASSANAGAVTLEENMADNGGARCAYEAYALAAERAPAVVQLRGLDAFEEEQLFFIAYCYKFCGIERSTAAQRFSTHPADKLRCNVPLLNMPEFATAFDCEPGAAMNPAQRCSAW